MVLWDRTFQEVAAEFPDVETESLLVDAAAMNFVRRPESFDVVVGSNLFGDILSDISAIIIGSMGLAASANLDPLRRFPSMFEPVHGSAPDIAGKGVVNPLATILSAAMMLDHLEHGRSRARGGSGGRRGAGRGQGAHARPRRPEQHRGSDRRGAGEAGLVAAAASSGRSTGRHAFLVAAGILLSRAGRAGPAALLLAAISARRDTADAFNAAFRIPNFLQNSVRRRRAFGLVHSGLRAPAGRRRRRRSRTAWPARSARSWRWSLRCLCWWACWPRPCLIDAIAPGFHGAKRELTIRLVRILFPGVGLLVLSAWCLGILNSHRKFFLSYTAPVVWNLAMIATLVAFRRQDRSRRSRSLTAWGSVAGSALQFGVQLPVVLRLARQAAPAAGYARRQCARSDPQFRAGVFQPRRGADQRLRGHPAGQRCWAWARWPALTNAQTLYLLPVSLFGMSVSAAELPAMSSALGDAGPGGRLPAAASRFRAAPDRLFHRAFRHGVSGAGRT